MPAPTATGRVIFQCQVAPSPFLSGFEHFQGYTKCMCRKHSVSPGSEFKLAKKSTFQPPAYQGRTGIASLAGTVSFDVRHVWGPTWILHPFPSLSASHSPVPDTNTPFPASFTKSHFLNVPFKRASEHSPAAASPLLTVFPQGRLEVNTMQHER